MLKGVGAEQEGHVHPEPMLYMTDSKLATRAAEGFTWHLM